MRDHSVNLRIKDLAHISEEQGAALSNVVVEPDDVLLNITGASVARCCIVDKSQLPARVNQHVAILRSIPNRVLPKFLELVLVAPQYKDRLLQDAQKAGATRQALTKDYLKDFNLKLPPLPEQKRIVTLLDEASTHSNSLVKLFVHKISQLKNLKQSLLQKAFTGELTSDKKAADRTLSEAGL